MVVSIGRGHNTVGTPERNNPAAAGTIKAAPAKIVAVSFNPMAKEPLEHTLCTGCGHTFRSPNR